VDQADAEFTPLDAKLTISSLNIASTGSLILPWVSAASSIWTQPLLAGRRSPSEGTMKFPRRCWWPVVRRPGVPVTVNFATKYNLRKNSGVLEPSTLNIGGAAAHLNGTYQNHWRVHCRQYQTQCQGTCPRKISKPFFRRWASICPRS